MSHPVPHNPNMGQISRRPREDPSMSTPARLVSCAVLGLSLLGGNGSVVGGEARLTAPDGRTRAYIDERGRISAPNGRTLGYVEPDGRISRPNGCSAGYRQNSDDVIDGLRSDPGRRSDYPDRGARKNR